jgi:hypothetical protein
MPQVIDLFGTQIEGVGVWLIMFAWFLFSVSVIIAFAYYMYAREKRLHAEWLAVAQRLDNPCLSGDEG